MDIEKARRQELSEALSEEFLCFEEVSLQHALFVRQTVRADLVAVPRDERLSGLALAFEVKEPDQTWHYAKWSKAVHQASDNVYGKIVSGSTASSFAGRRIAAAFLFPSPPYIVDPKEQTDSPYMRPAQEALHAGILHLALHFRVGYAFWNTLPKTPRFTLNFGPNRIWEQRFGYHAQAFNLISGSRAIGSRRIDFRSELDGFTQQ